MDANCGEFLEDSNNLGARQGEPVAAHGAGVR